MCFKQLVSLTYEPLTLVDQFVYFDSNISSTESDVNIRFGKAWTVIVWSLTIWKSYLSDWWTKRSEKKLDGNYTRMLWAVLKKSKKQYPRNKLLFGHLVLIL